MRLDGSPLASRKWRLSNLYAILDADGVLVPFSPNEAQRMLLNRLWFCNHILKARKLGFSTLFEILYLDDLLFNENMTAGIVDYTIEDAETKLSMMRTAYEAMNNPRVHSPEICRLGEKIHEFIPMRAAQRSIEFSNGSRATASTSMRGRTPQRLHISELGKTAIWAPIKAREIVNGAFNALTPGNWRNIESTHEGGKVGEHFRLLDGKHGCMRLDPDNLTEIQSRFHFFPWWIDPCYVLDGPDPIRQETAAYFQRLIAETGRAFTEQQMRWWQDKHDEQGHGMFKEFPSTPGEAFMASSEHGIYSKWMADLRAAGRICDFGLEANLPIYTAWDIGLSDYTSLWLIQPVHRWFLVLDWAEFEAIPASAMPDHILRWEAKWKKPVHTHFLPHDADRRSPNDGRSYAETLRAGGLENLTIVPRTPDVWLGIGYVRDILPHCWFHATHCDTPRTRPGADEEDSPSGVACLEGYQKDTSPAATSLREMPKHDLFSHSADAFRTWGEAWRRGMVSASTSRKPRAIR